MKIPYIKIPIADVAAYLAPFGDTFKGRVFQAVLDFGLYQKWADLECNEREQIGYTAVKEIVENEIKSYKKFCREQKNKAKKMWDKKQNHDEAAAMPNPKFTKCQTETETKAETDINKQHTASLAAGQVKPNPKLNKLQNFSNAVLAEFENLETKDQIAVWFKRNCRCLTDILRFCGGDIPTALETIRICVERLEKAGLTGGYEAVCRNLPEYYQAAKKRLNGGVYAK